MIDLDWLDEQLEQALTDELRAHRRSRPSPHPVAPPVARTAAPPSAGHDEPALPRRPPQLDLAGHRARIEELVAVGRLHEADLHIAAHAFIAGESGSVADRRDAAGWATMRAILDGRPVEAGAGADQVLVLGREAGDPAAWTRYLTLRYRLILEWGSADDRYELLDQCRAQAYWHDDVAWRGALTLLLARLGRDEEAARELDLTLERLLTAKVAMAVRLDVTTDLAEAAAVLGDAARASVVARTSGWPATAVVVVGRAEVCKGSVARYRALAAAAAGAAAAADRHYATAVEDHRRLGAPVLLARTLDEWAGSLAGRDDGRASALRRERTALVGAA